MTPKIESRSYSYVGDNVVTVSATLNLYEGEVVVLSTPLSAIGNLLNPVFMQDVQAALIDQVQAYLTKLSELNALRLERFPTSTSFEDAVNQVFDPIEIAIGGGQ